MATPAIPTITISRPLPTLVLMDHTRGLLVPTARIPNLLPVLPGGLERRRRGLDRQRRQWERWERRVGEGAECRQKLSKEGSSKHTRAVRWRSHCRCTGRKGNRQSSGTRRQTSEEGPLRHSHRIIETTTEKLAHIGMWVGGLSWKSNEFWIQQQQQTMTLRRLRPFYAPSYTTYPPSTMHPKNALNNRNYPLWLRLTLKAVQVVSFQEDGDSWNRGSDSGSGCDRIGARAHERQLLPRFRDTNEHGMARFVGRQCALMWK